MSTEPGGPNNLVITKNNLNLVEETTTIDSKKFLHQSLKIKIDEKIKVALPLKQKNTLTDSNTFDLIISTNTRSFEIKIEQSKGFTESVIQETIRMAFLQLETLPEYQIHSETKIQETSVKINPAGVLPNTSDHSTIKKNPLKKTDSETETNIYKHPKEGTSTEVLPIEPSSLYIIN